ncbi:MAG TPA: STAS domain-containing protein [Phycisphaerae bacterium]|nr:STAS domain-containing protein [Phycisphaerae bacterium]
MAERARILVSHAEGDDAVFLTATGPCALGLCPALKQYISRFNQPRHRTLYFDLSGVQSIDSTFTGFLLALATKRSNPAAPDLRLVAPSPRVLEAFRLMHLKQFFHIQPDMPPLRAEWVEISLAAEGVEALRNTVLDAHEQLINADARNATEFARVVEGLREERDRHSGLGRES